MDRGFDMGEVLGVTLTANRAFKLGWKGSDLKEFVEDAKENSYSDLDSFAGGELEALRGTPLFSVMLEITAIRYAAHIAEGMGKVAGYVNPFTDTEAYMADNEPQLVEDDWEEGGEM